MYHGTGGPAAPRGERTVANGKLLRQLIPSGAQGDVDAFRGAAREVIAEERQKQHHLLANDLETILYGTPRTPPSPVVRKLAAAVPEDRERGLPLLDVREPARSLDDVVLSPANRSLIEALLGEHNREEILKAHGLRPNDRMLLCGPPGCGKTLTAEVIATELGRPQAIVRTDSVGSSFLGETAANLRKVFDFLVAHPMVALFDEFDALGKERDDPAEHRELRRVVNAVLQMLDAYAGRSILLPATNHDGMLDSAVWRRFDEVFVPAAPNRRPARSAAGSEAPERSVRLRHQGGGWFKSATHADVEREVRRAIKAMTLEGGEPRLHLEHPQAARWRVHSGLRRTTGRTRTDT